jgi:acyl carrier protein
MFENVRDFLVEELRKKPENITLDAELVGDLGINSLELAELILACEERFNVQIDDEDLHRFTTVGDIVAYLEENQ